jgi:hypothetical protein
MPNNDGDPVLKVDYLYCQNVCSSMYSHTLILFVVV